MKLTVLKGTTQWQLIHAQYSTTTTSACVLSHFGRVRLFVTLWTVAHQASLSMQFSRKEYWNEMPLTSPGHLPDAGNQPMSLTSPTLPDDFFTTSANWEAEMLHSHSKLWRWKWQPTPVFLPGQPHGQRSLTCYSPWGRKESDMT